MGQEMGPESFQDPLQFDHVVFPQLSIRGGEDPVASGDVIHTAGKETQQEWATTRMSETHPWPRGPVPRLDVRGQIIAVLRGIQLLAKFLHQPLEWIRMSRFFFPLKEVTDLPVAQSKSGLGVLVMGLELLQDVIQADLGDSPPPVVVSLSAAAPSQLLLQVDEHEGRCDIEC
jgi:hypothetical protein